MILFNRKVDTLLADLFSNDALEIFLDGLPWKYDESYHAEVLKMSEVGEVSMIMESFLQGIAKIQIDDYRYFIQGHLIFRTHPNLPKPVKKQKQSFTVTEINNE